MKNLFILTLGILLMSSCQKEWSCECEMELMQTEKQIIYFDSYGEAREYKKMMESGQFTNMVGLPLEAKCKIR